MIIGLVTKTCCIRVLKEMWPLKKLGFDFRLYTEYVPACVYGLLEPQHVITWNDYDDLTAKLEQSEADIFHVHTEPTYMVTLTKKVTGKPVIFDCHDLWWDRTGETYDYEQEAFDNADAVVWVSKEYASEAPYKRNCPEVYVPPAVPIDWYVEPQPGNGKVVFQGACASPDQAIVYQMPYYDMTEIVKGFPGMTMFIPKNQDAQRYYKSLGARVKRGLDYFQLLQAISRFSWGLGLRGGTWTGQRLGRANKPFDNIAAGIPTIAPLGTAWGEWVVKNDLGIAIDKPGPLPDDARFREWILKVRPLFSMERYIQPVADLYRRFA